MTARPIDAYAPVRHGRYDDGVVEVRRRGPGVRRRTGEVRTAHFDVRRDGQHLQISHTLALTEIDDDLAGLLSVELFEPGWLRGAELFERVFTGVVRTCADDADDAWAAFYENTIAAVDRCADRGSAAGGGTSGHGSIAGYAPVHAHASGLVRGRSVLELGSCFGFLALRLAGAGHRVTASDVSAGTMALLARMSARLGPDVRTLTCDAARVPLAAEVVDTVLAVHLLEHLDPEHAGRVVAEACRLARHRVVVAVPFEEVPSEEYGHLWAVTPEALERWGRAADGWQADVHEHHGGWLVLDREPDRAQG